MAKRNKYAVSVQPKKEVKKPVQEVFELVDSKDKTKLLYYAYLPEESK